jgi:hypothetical protein
MALATQRSHKGLVPTGSLCRATQQPNRWAVLALISNARCHESQEETAVPQAPTALSCSGAFQNRVSGWPSEKYQWTGVFAP